MTTMIGDCADTTEEMTVDSRDSKDLQLDEITDEHSNSNDPNVAHTHSHIQHRENATPETDVDMTETRQTPINSPASNVAYIKSSSSPDIHMDINCNKSPASVLSTMSKSKPSITDTGDSNSADSPPAQKRARTEDTNDSQSPSPTSTPTLTLSTSTSPTHSNIVPKLRLNALLAADPALKPDARDLKALHEEAQSKQQRKNNVLLPEPPALLKQEDYDVMQSHNLSETSLLNKAPQNAPSTVATEMPTRMKVFMCLPCGIGFSSPSTLEAHQAFYCSHRNKDNDENNPVLSTTAADKRGSPTSNANAANTSATTAGNNANMEPTAKATKTGKQYACTQCSYSADKKVSLNRHMRMHQSSPASSSNSAANGSAISAAIAGAVGAAMALEENASQQVDRYCSDCDIRFSNIKTYRAHKQHYCSSRRTEGQLTPKLESSANVTTPAKPGNVGAASLSPQARTKTPTQAMVAAAAAAVSLQQQTTQPFFALPTNPILIIPYSLVRMGSLIPGPPAISSGGILNTDSTCFMFDNGSWKPLATAALNMNALNPTAAAATTTVASSRETAVSRDVAHSNNNEALLTEKNSARNVEAAEVTPKRKEAGVRETAPLDLSLRRSPIVAIQQRLRAAGSLLEMDTLLEASKENLRLEETGSITPEQIVCAPSLPNSPSMSPSPKRRVISPRSSGAGSTSSMSPPASVQNSAGLAVVAAAGNLLDNLPLRSMLPADLALKFSESNMMNPLLTKQNLEFALKISAAAAAINSSGGMAAGATPAEIAAAAVAAVGTSSLLAGLPVVPTAAAAATSSPSQPQIYVKQGVSKCKECNIVFCKYENYLAHKQHYCSARNQESTENETKVAGTPPMASNAATAENTTVAYQQLICAACGIKYTSLDNLRAHQNYYCPKGAALAAVTSATETSQLPPPKEKCAKCKIIHELGLPCPPPPALQQPAAPVSSSSSTGGNVYKCPLCDAVSLTASESRKHMETHGSVKAFRCSICRYKGNTLRGMRTHIRMHFDKKTTDFNEEHYMSCILEDDGIEIPSTASLNQEQLAQHLVTAQQQAVAAAVAAATLQQQQQQQVFNCDICNYSSSYKGNVLRHMKLVHPQLINNSPSISPETSLPSVELKNSMDANSLYGNMNGENNGAHSFPIKSEPIEAPPTSSSLSENIIHENNNSPPITISASNVTPSPHIKTEPLDITADQTTTSNSMPHLPSRTHASPAPAQQTDELSQKYCQTCDISFNYMKTYLAHKQFYCKNKIGQPRDERSSPTTAVMSILPPVSPDPLLLRKTKESLQQEAAI